MKIALESSVPSDLFEVYETVMDAIRQSSDDTQELAQKILSWILYAKRPLKINELREAIAIREGDKSLEEDDLMPADEIIEVCGGLIDYDAGSGNVTFSHEMVQDFLNSRYVDRLLSRIELCKISLTYLSFNVFKAGPCTDEASYKARMEFSRYVAQYWGRHVKEVENENPEVYDMALETIRFVTIMDSMTQLAIAKKSSDWSIPEKHRGKQEMHIFAEYDLAYFAEKYQEVESAVSAGLGDNPDEDDLFEKFSQDLEKYYKVSVRTNDGLTQPLHLAAEQGHVKLVEILLKAGANVNNKNGSGKTPLHIACTNGYFDVVKSLLKAHASVEITDNYGARPLHWASLNGSIEIINALLESGDPIEANYKSNTGATAFLCAVSSGNLEAAHRLREMSVDICLTMPSGYNTFHAIAAGGNVKLFDLLPQNVEMDIDGIYKLENSTPLYMAADNGYVEIVERLLKLGADVNISCDDGRLPLHAAAEYGHLEVVKMLLKANSSLDHQCNTGRTALYLASREDKISVVESLLEAGADPNVINYDGWVPLHIAASKNRKEIVNKLLEAGAFIDVLTANKPTALSLAIDAGHNDIAEQLVEAGAHPLISRSVGGWSPLWTALYRGYDEIARSMLAKMEMPFTSDGEINEAISGRFGKLSLEASAHYELLLYVTKVVPRDYSSVTILADFYLSQGFYDLAIVNYDMSLSLYPPNLHVSDINDVIHEYICDGCGKDPVQGNLFRCVSCKDYGLCQNCMEERPQPHNEHELIRIPSEQWLSQHLNLMEPNLLLSVPEPERSTVRVESNEMEIDGYTVCGTLKESHQRIYILKWASFNEIQFPQNTTNNFRLLTIYKRHNCLCNLQVLQDCIKRKVCSYPSEMVDCRLGLKHHTNSHI